MRSSVSALASDADHRPQFLARNASIGFDDDDGALLKGGIAFGLALRADRVEPLVDAGRHRPRQGLGHVAWVSAAYRSARRHNPRQVR